MSKESGVSAEKLRHQAGHNIFGWDVEWSYDQRTGAPTSIAEKIFSEIRYALKHGNTFTPNHCILLMHERHFIKKDYVSRLIDLCRKEEYKFEHLNHYPNNQGLEN